jgi:hypothetical protein
MEAAAFVGVGSTGVVVAIGLSSVGAGYGFELLVGATTGGLAWAVCVANTEISIPVVVFVVPGTGKPSLVSVAD